jgi:uncharacterized protein
MVAALCFRIKLHIQKCFIQKCFIHLCIIFKLVCMQAPFVFGKITAGENFTDRENEISWLIERFSASTNCMLISPRRWGKSSLVKRVTEKMKHNQKDKLFCFIDLYKVRSEQEFYELFAMELIKATNSGFEEIVNTAKKIFKQLLPKISLSPDNSNNVSLSFSWNDLKKNPAEILNLPETLSKLKKRQIIVCIDEFQNISFFDNALAFQKKARAHWQQHQHAHYCLYGSKRHLLSEFFTKSSMPFYRFGEILFLEKIPLEYWKTFIVKRFSDFKKTISSAQAEKIATSMENHPYFVQQLSQAVWFRTPKVCSDDIINYTLNELLDQYTILYQKDVDGLTNIQLNFLKALCNKESRFTSHEILTKYKIGASANIKRIKEALESKEIIEIWGKSIMFNDPLFEKWLNQKFFI